MNVGFEHANVVYTGLSLLDTVLVPIAGRRLMRSDGTVQISPISLQTLFLQLYSDV